MTMIDTLAAAKRELWEAMKGKGAACPCCARFAKLHPYQISQAQAHAFRWIVDNVGQDGFIDVQGNAPRWLLQSNSHGKLVHWALLQTKPTDDRATKMSGVWGPTQFGMDWFNGLVTVQKYALVFDNKCHGHRGPAVKFTDVFERFSYDVLMAVTARGVT